jgi:hypothetical protein
MKSFISHTDGTTKIRRPVNSSTRIFLDQAFVDTTIRRLPPDLEAYIHTLLGLFFRPKCLSAFRLCLNLNLNK